MSKWYPVYLNHLEFDEHLLKLANYKRYRLNEDPFDDFDEYIIANIKPKGRFKTNLREYLDTDSDKILAEWPEWSVLVVKFKSRDDAINAKMLLTEFLINPHPAAAKKPKWLRDE